MTIKISDYIQSAQVEDVAAPPPGWHVLLLITLALAGAAVYANMLENPFVMRDTAEIVNNDRLHELGTSFYGTQPIANLTLAINYGFGALAPSGYHAVNLLIHVLAGLTLYGIIRRTLNTARLRERFGAGAVWIAFACALIWLIHPLQTEVVSYSANRAEALVTLFYLLTWYCVIRGTASLRGTGWLVAAIVASALGMGSKGTMVTAPIVILMFDRIYLARSLSSLFKRRGWLYAGLFGTWGVLFVNGLIPSMFESSASPSVPTATGFTPAEYAMTQAGVILQYLKLSYWPQSLCVDYHWNPVRSPFGAGAIPILIALALAVWTLVTLLRRPAIGFVAACFFLTLAPTSSVLPHWDPLSEHRMYLPLAAIVVLTVLMVHTLLMEFFGKASGSRYATAGLLLLLATPPLAYGTIVRNQDYKDDLTMWNDVVEKRPGNYRGPLGVGMALKSLGEFVDAEAALRFAVALADDAPDAHFQLGDLLYDQLRHREAFDEITRAVELGMSDATAYMRLGGSSSALGRYDVAVDFYNQALAAQPGFAEAYYHQAEAMMLDDKTEAAITSYDQAITANPNYFEAHQGISIAFAKSDRLEASLRACDEALRLRPTDEGANLQRRLIVQKIAQQPKPEKVDGANDGADEAADEPNDE